MLESKKIEMLNKKVDSLKEDNQRLYARVKELEKFLPIIEAANKYTDEHKIAMRAAAEAKERYELAYKQMIALKKEYEKRMEKVLKDFE